MGCHVIPRPFPGKLPAGKFILNSPRYFETLHALLRMFTVGYDSVGEDEVST
jgi:hypothetical protein